MPEEIDDLELLMATEIALRQHHVVVFNSEQESIFLIGQPVVQAFLILTQTTVI